MRPVLLFIPAGDPDARKWMVKLWNHCTRRKYKPEAVVHEWADVRQLMLDGAAEMVVVARRAHVDWLEVASDRPESDAEPDPPGQRRVRRQR